MLETDIINIALENLTQIPGIEGTWYNEGSLDGRLEITIYGHKYISEVEIKRNLRTHQLNQIEEYFHRYENFLLVAFHIFPNIKKKLQDKGISYLEANGNFFLKNKYFLVLVDQQKPIEPTRPKGNRAFTKTGLKVLFYLLQHKDAIDLTHRELAKKTGVSLGTIPQVIEGLRQTGYLIPLNKKSHLWENRKELLEKWIEGYATILRPKLVKGSYTIKDSWRKISLDSYKTVWGGEPAADLLTNHLRPEKLLIYTQENRKDLIKKYGLIPDSKGELEVLEMFWEQEKGDIAHPILIYAELIWNGGKRNIETAEKIYNEYIQPNL